MRFITGRRGLPRGGRGPPQCRDVSMKSGGPRGGFVPEAPYDLPVSALRLKSPWGELFPQRTAPGAKKK